MMDGLQFTQQRQITADTVEIECPIILSRLLFLKLLIDSLSFLPRQKPHS